MKELITQTISNIHSMIERNNELYQLISDIDTEGLVSVDWIGVDFDELSFSFTQDSLEVRYEHWSFSEDFSQSWTIPYELLELSDADIPDYVAKKIAEYKEQEVRDNQAEIARLKRQIEILEGRYDKTNSHMV